MIATNIVSDGVEPIGRRRRAFAAIAATTTLAALDVSIANVALPTMARELHVGAASIVWVINGFNLAVAAALFASAGCASSFGFLRVYRAGVVLFTVGSLLCALSGSFGLLIGSRVAQGVGAAMIMAIQPAIMRSIFPRAQLARAFGYTALTVSTGVALGPTLGGLILAIAPWPWLFAVNVPVAVIAIVLGAGALPETRGTGARVDVISVLTSAIGFSLLVYGIDGISRAEPALSVALQTGIGAVIFAWFVIRQFRLPHPMIALDLFRIPAFAGAAGTSLASWVAWGIGFVTLPFVLQLDRGVSPLVSGLLLTAWPVGTAVAAPTAGRLAGRFPIAVIAAVGMALFALAMTLFAIFSHVAPPLALMACSALAGVGFGGYQTPNNAELLGSAPLEKSASASALLATLRVSGQTFGASTVAIVFGLAEHARPLDFARVAAPIALGIATACAIGASIVSLWRRDASRR
jgi:DHA2 family multidrug resistance protein-like MFS transporter